MKLVTDTSVYRLYRRVRRRVRKDVFGQPAFLDRVVLYRELDRIASELPLAEMDALEISGARWASKPFRSYINPAYATYDVCEKPYTPEGFDFIVAEQVFEHLLYPYRAAKNVYAMLKPGGYFLVSSPFLQKRHDEPVDCSRWTPLGMQYFLSEAGFPLESIKTGSWGNRRAAKANMDPFDYPAYVPLLHSLKNDEMFPVQVWALARK